MSIRRAMLFAAGLGTRLRPLTDTVPKPLIEVGGRALLDYNLMSFIEFGCDRVVINTHYHADQLAQHLAKLSAERPALGSAIRISHETELLETGGGIVQALPLLATDELFSANSDAFWVDGQKPALARLAEAWDPARMDALLLLVPPEQAVGFAGRCDFALRAGGEAASQLVRGPASRFVFTGLQILSTRLFAGRHPGPFSLRELYAAAQSADGSLRRMFGIVHDAAWMHVGTPAEREAVDAYLTGRAAAPTS